MQFIDQFSRNEIAGEDISSLVRYEVDVIDPLRPMLERTNTHITWEQDLGDTCESGSTLSVADLERAFLIDRPVLFLGSVSEVEILDTGDFRILMRPNSILPSHHAIKTCLEVSLSAPKETMITFSEKMLSFDDGLDDELGVAVAAQIKSIEKVDLGDESVFEYRIVLYCDLVEIDHADELTLHGHMRERVLDRLQKH